MVAKVITALQLVPHSHARAAAAADVPAAPLPVKLLSSLGRRREFGGLRLAPESDNPVTGRPKEASGRARDAQILGADPVAARELRCQQPPAM